MSHINFRFQEIQATLRGAAERQLSVGIGRDGRAESIIADLILPPVHARIDVSDARSVKITNPSAALTDAIEGIKGAVSRSGGVEWLRVTQPLEGAAQVSFRAAGSHAVATSMLLDQAPSHIRELVTASRQALRLAL